MAVLMKKLILGSMALAAMIARPALAADMAVKAPPIAPPIAAPVYSWTGCYIGGNVGGAWAHKTTTWNYLNGPSSPVNEGSLTASGWAYGGQIGCDYQFNNNWVVGIRGMWDGSDMRGSEPWTTIPADFSNYKIDSFGTVVGKIGVLLNPTFELYGLAGVAWVRDNLSFTCCNIGTYAIGDQTRTGYDVGVGIAWMFARNLDLFVEYDHMGFGTKFLYLTGVGLAAGNLYGANVEQSVDKVLVGIDYHFGAPVVAK